MRSFNPHTHAGCDDLMVGTFRLKMVVSIHTPTQGVTAVTIRAYGLSMFQSTHPRRV